MSAEQIKVFWQPWCTSCLKVKEYLTDKGVEYESINVLDGDYGRSEMARLGARSIPIVSRGSDFVFAQNLKEVARFVGLDAHGGPALSPSELVATMDKVLTTTLRLIVQMPADKLQTNLPKRERSYRVLCHHVFGIPDAFLSAQDGAKFTYEELVAEPDDSMQTTDQIATYGRGVRERFLAWWDGLEDVSCTRTIDTYYGDQSVHDLLERTVWHSTQHSLQVQALLEDMGITPDGPLSDADVAGLPLPSHVWDA